MLTQDVSLIGFGEAGQAFAGARGWRGIARAYDRLTDRPEPRSAKQAEYLRATVRGCGSTREAVFEAGLVLSLVTANQALAAAGEVAEYLRPGALFCDMNSVAPGTKQAAAAMIEAAGGRYVDVAIMSPVTPARLDVPLLLSGPAAEDAHGALGALGFSNIRRVGPRVGQASAIKMIRSVVVKGIEALTAEAMLAAELTGVTEEVLASLDASEKSCSWFERADYNLDRMIVHGARRAEEMGEAVKMLEQLGVEPAMTRATVRCQDRIGALRLGRPAPNLAGKIEQIATERARAA
ncbi:MAG TPA: DUF1932 domain-containing protein [Allosphingosinicella sp.]|jgi:3-hydroxyisobutyrate dehydrogenase-like beta-hydroxyacid dehydrogenase